MYSKMRVEYTLRPDTPELAIKALQWLLFAKDRGEHWLVCPFKDGHEFWQKERHHQIGCDYDGCSKPSSDVWDNCSLDCEDLSWNSMVQNTDGTWSIVASSSCKNYDQQMQLFCSWIFQFSVRQDVHIVGRFKHEEWRTYVNMRSDGTHDYPVTEY